MGSKTPSNHAVCYSVAQGHGVIINMHNGSHWVLITSLLSLLTPCPQQLEMMHPMLELTQVMVACTQDALVGTCSM
jgi:hypothetical protein